MTDQPIKRGRGSSTLDRRLEEQVLGESRVYKHRPEHRRSTGNLAFGSRMASDRGMDLNATTTAEPRRSDSARPRRPGRKTTASRHPRSPAPSSRVDVSQIPIATTSQEIVRSPPAPRADPLSLPTATNIKRERLSSGSPSPKRSRIQSPSPASASASTITCVRISITADTTTNDNFAPVQPTSAGDSTGPWRLVKCPDSDDE